MKSIALSAILVVFVQISRADTKERGETVGDFVKRFESNCMHNDTSWFSVNLNMKRLRLPALPPYKSPLESDADQTRSFGHSLPLDKDLVTFSRFVNQQQSMVQMSCGIGTVSKNVRQVVAELQEKLDLGPPLRQDYPAPMPAAAAWFKRSLQGGTMIVVGSGLGTVFVMSTVRRAIPPGTP